MGTCGSSARNGGRKCRRVTYLCHDGAGTDGGVLANPNARQDSDAASDEDILTDYHRPSLGFAVRNGSILRVGAQGRSVDGDVRTQERTRADVHGSRVHDGTVRADDDLAADLDVVPELARERSLDSDARSNAVRTAAAPR